MTSNHLSTADRLQPAHSEDGFCLQMMQHAVRAADTPARQTVYSTRAAQIAARLIAGEALNVVAH